jgi:predicted acylesterase/phospholipase RssA
MDSINESGNSDEWGEWGDWDKFTDDINVELRLKTTDFKRAKTLVLPSGGVKGLYLLGALHYLHEHFGINHITSYYGCSIGSIISGLLIIGFTPMDILVYICIKKIVTYLIDSFTLTTLLTDNTVLDATILTTLLTEMIKSKVGYIPTMGDLLKTYHKRLCVVTISRDNPDKPIYISSQSHPDLSMVQALHMSSSIPFIFGYASYNDVQYFDGGLLDQFPILYAEKNDEMVFGIDLIRIYTKSDVIWQDILEIISLPISYISETLKKQTTKSSYINIHTQNEHVVKSNVGFVNMFISGYRQCKTEISSESELSLELLNNYKKEKKE